MQYFRTSFSRRTRSFPNYLYGAGMRMKKGNCAGE